MARNTIGLRASVESRRAKLAFGERGAYSIESLESGRFSTKELRQEYSRLRGIVSKRISRLEASEWLTSEGTVPYNLRKEYYPALKDLRDERELAIKLRELATVVESPRSRIYGLEQIREQSVKTMQEEGYDWVTEENWRDFSEFMKKARSMAHGRWFDSDRAVEIFENAPKTKKGTANKNELRKAFKTYLDTLDQQVENIPEVKR